MHNIQKAEYLRNWYFMTASLKAKNYHFLSTSNGGSFTEIGDWPILYLILDYVEPKYYGVY